MTGAAPHYLSDFLTGPWIYYLLLRPKCGNPIAALLREAGIARDSGVHCVFDTHPPLPWMVCVVVSDLILK
jgi:hypothetical protein